jgi:hypothetical protein
MAGEVATDVIRTSQVQHRDWPLPTLRMLAVIPLHGKGGSMIFVRRQLESLRTLHIDSQPFFPNAGTSPRLLLMRWGA